MPLQRIGPRVVGRLGASDHRTPDSGDSRAQTGTDAVGRLPVVLDRHEATVHATGARAWADGRGVSWAPHPLPGEVPASAAQNASGHDALSVGVDDEGGYLQAGISGATPIYVSEHQAGLSFASSISALTQGRALIDPDFDGWAQMLATGAPLGGRTTVAGVQRLQPCERARVSADGRVHRERGQWPWLDIEPGGSGSVQDVAQALAGRVNDLAARGPLAPLLSGGWDSRILTTLAHRAQGEALTGRTTSSDTGTVIEELVAAQVAQRLRIDHRIVAPRADQIADDIDYFATSVDYQTAFHIWLVPLARELDSSTGTVLDGLGGGLFAGGAFPDDAGHQGSVLEHRFARLSHYLGAAPRVLAARAIEPIRERARAGFMTAAKPLVDHPFAATFTAYLNRTLPGISQAPYGLVGSRSPVATPFLDDTVVRTALSLAPELHSGGRLYPQILAQFDQGLANLPTAQDLSPWPRPHPRRISSLAAATHIRELVLAPQVRMLVNDELASAPVQTWRELLSNTGAQHLLRSLAVMSLWFIEHQSALAGQDASGVL